MDTSDAPVLPPIRPVLHQCAATNAASASTVPPTINCSASPTSLRAGGVLRLAVRPQVRITGPINITYVANGGKLSSNRNQATLDTTDTGPGPIAVRATAFDDRQLKRLNRCYCQRGSRRHLPMATAQKLMELRITNRTAATWTTVPRLSWTMSL